MFSQAPKGERITLKYFYHKNIWKQYCAAIYFNLALAMSLYVSVLITRLHIFLLDSFITSPPPSPPSHSVFTLTFALLYAWLISSLCQIKILRFSISKNPLQYFSYCSCSFILYVAKGFLEKRREEKVFRPCFN